MQKFKFDLNKAEPDKPTTAHGSHCSVYGCPREGQIKTASWSCRYHHGKSGSNLNRITLVLKNHAREIDWHEYLLRTTPVDFLVGDVARKAPDGLRVLPNETYKAYRARVALHIETLLMPKSRLLEVAP